MPRTRYGGQYTTLCMGFHDDVNLTRHAMTHGSCPRLTQVVIELMQEHEWTPVVHCCRVEAICRHAYMQAKRNGLTASQHPFRQAITAQVTRLDVHWSVCSSCGRHFDRMHDSMRHDRLSWLSTACSWVAIILLTVLMNHES